MTPNSLSFRASGAAASTPNIMVDASPNPATVLLLDHGPHSPQPIGFRHDNLSAEMAFRYADEPIEHPPAEVVTTDHVDGDAAVSVLALIDPERARTARTALIALARACDFRTYRDRNAARAAMAVRTLADPARSPIDEARGEAGPPDDEAVEAVMAHTLDILIDLADTPERFRELWEAEDEHLARTEDVIEDGRVSIVEHPVDQLSLILLDPDLTVDAPDELAPNYQAGPFDTGSAWGPLPGGAHLHMMPVNNAARGFRQLMVQGRQYRYLDRLETWYQYRGRKLPNRIDLRAVADDLNFLEGGRVWEADPPSEPIASLATVSESNLDLETVTTLLVRQLRSAPAAWDPFLVDGQVVDPQPPGWTRS